MALGHKHPSAKNHSVSSILLNLLDIIFNFMEVKIWRKERGSTITVVGNISAACLSALINDLVLLGVVGVMNTMTDGAQKYHCALVNSPSSENKSQVGNY